MRGVATPPWPGRDALHLLDALAHENVHSLRGEGRRRTVAGKTASGPYLLACALRPVSEPTYSHGYHPLKPVRGKELLWF